MRVLMGAALAALILLPVRAQGLTGVSSLVTTPTAATWEDGSVASSLALIPDVCLNKCPEPGMSVSGLIGIQFLPFLQVGLRIWRTAYERYENQQGIGDRSLIVHLRLWGETTWRPALALGARDPLINTPQFAASYVVLSKSLWSRLSGFSLHAGYGIPPERAANYPLEGFFGGVSITPHPAFRFLFDYDTRHLNVGLAGHPLRGVELTIAAFHLTAIGAGITYSLQL